MSSKRITQDFKGSENISNLVIKRVPRSEFVIVIDSNESLGQVKHLKHVFGVGSGQKIRENVDQN